MAVKVLVAGAAVGVTAMMVCWRRSAQALEEEREKDRRSREKSENALEGLTEIERQRRMRLEEEVRILKQEKEDKMREIERLKEVKMKTEEEQKRMHELAIQVFPLPLPLHKIIAKISIYRA